MSERTLTSLQYAFLPLGATEGDTLVALMDREKSLVKSQV